MTRGILNILDISSTSNSLENSKTPEIDDLVKYFVDHYNGWMEKGNLTQKKKQNLHKTFTIMVFGEKHKPDEIKQVIDWLAMGRSWWGDKIDAGYKFQEHYAKVWQEMKSKKNNGKTISEKFDEEIDKLNGHS